MYLQPQPRSTMEKRELNEELQLTITRNAASNLTLSKDKSGKVWEHFALFHNPKAPITAFKAIVAAIKK